MESPSIIAALRKIPMAVPRVPVSKKSVRDFFLAPPELLNGDRLAATLNRLILVRVLILSVLLGTCTLEMFSKDGNVENTKFLFWAFAGIYFISLVNAWCIRCLQNPRRVGYAQLTVDVILSTLAVYMTGPVVTIALYLALIVAAALVFSRHGAVIVAALAGICYGIIASGLLPAFHGRGFSASTQEILGVYIALVTISLVSGYLARQLEILGTLAVTNAKTLDDLTQKQMQLFNDISDGVITLDLTSAVTSINEAARAIIGLSALTSEHFVGRPFKSVFKECGLDGSEQLLLDQKAGPGPSEATLRGMEPEKEIHLNYSVKSLADSQGNINGKIVIFNDISHVKNIQDRLQLHERMMKLLSDTNEIPVAARLTGVELEMIGTSPVMKRVFTLVQRVANSDASVLITGESGTGKELIARAIHMNSARSKRAFVAINCGAIPENLIESELFGHKKGSFTGAINDNPGLFRQAQDGTIFLDEVGELPLHLQTKLLRALQEKTVRSVGDIHDHAIDVRIVAATNRDLKKEIASGRFREDLYYRLNVVHVMVPPLRDRKEDIPLMVRHFIALRSDPDIVLPQISPDALQLLVNHSFPGNVRELENIIERALVLGGSAILPEHLPEELLHNGKRVYMSSNTESHALGDRETEIAILPIDLEAELEKLERQYLFQALNQSGGVKKHAAELLGLNFRSFRYRLKKYGLANDLGDEN